MLLKTSNGTNSHLFAYLRFCAFAGVYLCRLVLLVVLVLLVCAKSFRKTIKGLKLP